MQFDRASQKLKLIGRVERRGEGGCTLRTASTTGWGTECGDRDEELNSEESWSDLHVLIQAGGGIFSGAEYDFYGENHVRSWEAYPESITPTRN